MSKEFKFVKNDIGDLETKISYNGEYYKILISPRETTNKDLQPVTVYSVFSSKGVRATIESISDYNSSNVLFSPSEIEKALQEGYFFPNARLVKNFESEEKAKEFVLQAFSNSDKEVKSVESIPVSNQTSNETIEKTIHVVTRPFARPEVTVLPKVVEPIIVEHPVNNSNYEPESVSAKPDHPEDDIDIAEDDPDIEEEPVIENTSIAEDTPTAPEEVTKNTLDTSDLSYFGSSFVPDLKATIGSVGKIPMPSDTLSKVTSSVNDITEMLEEELNKSVIDAQNQSKQVSSSPEAQYTGTNIPIASPKPINEIIGKSTEENLFVSEEADKAVKQPALKQEKKQPVYQKPIITPPAPLQVPELNRKPVENQEVVSASKYIAGEVIHPEQLTNTKEVSLSELIKQVSNT